MTTYTDAIASKYHYYYNQSGLEGKNCGKIPSVKMWFHVIPCLHVSMLSCFHASILSCVHAFMLPWYRWYMLEFPSVLISKSTTDSLTHSETWPLIQMLSHLISLSPSSSQVNLGHTHVLNWNTKRWKRWFTEFVLAWLIRDNCCIACTYTYIYYNFYNMYWIWYRLRWMIDVS